MPDEPSAAIESVKSLVTYGWGAIPVTARIGDTNFSTSLFPKGEFSLAPVKDAVRKAEQLSVGNVVTVTLLLDV